jgi:hypothetical protein
METHSQFGAKSSKPAVDIQLSNRTSFFVTLNSRRPAGIRTGIILFEA